MKAEEEQMDKLSDAHTDMIGCYLSNQTLHMLFQVWMNVNNHKKYNEK